LYNDLDFQKKIFAGDSLSKQDPRAKKRMISLVNKNMGKKDIFSKDKSRASGLYSNKTIGGKIDQNYLIDLKQKPLKKRSDEISFLTNFTPQGKDKKHVKDSDKTIKFSTNGPQARWSRTLVKRSQSRDFLQIDLQLDSSKNRKEVKFHKDIVESSRQRKDSFIKNLSSKKKQTTSFHFNQKQENSRRKAKQLSHFIEYSDKIGVFGERKNSMILS